MKKRYALLLLFPLLLTLLSCNKDDDKPVEPVDLLPPITQTGAGTFAALVDGKPFIDKSGGWFNCFYQLVDGEYYFGIQGLDKVEMLTSVGISTNKMKIEEGYTYILTDPIEENSASGGGGSN